ncbi:MAG: cell division protein ZapE [Sulfuricellaceae bacterium]|nr:cell division protein ZapE [Sulfuricellaceae bacterium]
MSPEVIACLGAQAAQRGLILDDSQTQVVLALQRVHEDLQQTRSPLKLWFRPAMVRGVYIWGAVGRGKSFVMDSFFDCIPLAHKRRVHYHHFMQEIHGQLAHLKGKPYPLRRLAQAIVRYTRLLCLDEFHITDIADAMLMRGLLQALMESGVVLVMTSNSAPDQLYRDGLQRSQFLPAIALIKAGMEVLCLDGGTDYRQHLLSRADMYHSPLNEQTEEALLRIFQIIGNGVSDGHVELQVEGRALVARHVGDGLAWFDFQTLCSGPRSKPDYIDLAGRFYTLIVSGIPVFNADRQAEARRFLWLIDELYDKRVKLILSAEAPLAELGSPDLLSGEFRRALSRLAEMQSVGYADAR